MRWQVTFSHATDDKNDKHRCHLLQYMRLSQKYQDCLCRCELIFLYTGTNVSEQPTYKIKEHSIPEHHIHRTVIWYTNMKYNKLGNWYLNFYYTEKHFIFFLSTTVWEPNLQNRQNPKLWPHILTTKDIYIYVNIHKYRIYYTYKITSILRSSVPSPPQWNQQASNHGNNSWLLFTRCPVQMSMLVCASASVSLVQIQSFTGAFIWSLSSHFVPILIQKNAHNL